MNNCALCRGLQATADHDWWNEPLWETTNFAVIPSLGALVPGWVLLVPKEHVLAIGALSDALVRELNVLKMQISGALSTHYCQPVVAFEHGPSQDGSNLGCGVDHAHLHLVPADIDLESAMCSKLPKGASWRPADFSQCRLASSKGEGYLYYEQPLNVGRIAIATDFEGQLFRRGLAEQLGLTNQYRWREYPQLQNVRKTIDDSRFWRAGLQSCRQETAA
jgi:ATP adenylyltransferase